MKELSQRNRERFQHILKAIEKIESYTNGLNEDDFVQESIINEAVLFQLSIIGEAIHHISNEILKKYHYCPTKLIQ